jgi:anti-anti-sigma factor
MSTLSLHTYQEPDSVRVSVSGELDLSSALTFDEEMRRIEEHCEARLLVLDLSSLKFMDSTGLRLILSTHARAIKRGHRLVIVQGGEAVRRIFRITGVTGRLNLCDDVATAATPSRSGS